MRKRYIACMALKFFSDLVFRGVNITTTITRLGRIADEPLKMRILRYLAN